MSFSFFKRIQAEQALAEVVSAYGQQTWWYRRTACPSPWGWKPGLHLEPYSSLFWCELLPLRCWHSAGYTQKTGACQSRLSAGPFWIWRQLCVGILFPPAGRTSHKATWSHSRWAQSGSPVTSTEIPEASTMPPCQGSTGPTKRTRRSRQQQADV